MSERVWKDSLITFVGLVLYVGSIKLQEKYGVSSGMEFGCFFAAYLLSAYSVFENIAYQISKKRFLDGNLLIVIATIGLFGLGNHEESVAVMLIYEIGNLVSLANRKAEKEQRKRTKVEKNTTRAIGVYTCIVLLVFAAMLIVPKFIVTKYTYESVMEISFLFLVAACPCALSVSVPAAFHGGIRAAAKRGILIRNEKCLEILEKTNSFLLDKTGTLTENDLLSDIKEMVKYLKKNCQAVVGMVTGGTQISGKSVAKMLELDYYYAEQIPEEKAKRVEEVLEMQDDTEYLAVVGNGLRDLPVLEKADIGIVMGVSSLDEVSEAVDIALVKKEPMAVVDAIRIAKETMKVIRQNRNFTIVMKIIVLTVAMLGMLSVRQAVIAEVSVALIAVFNAVWASKDPV